MGGEEGKAEEGKDSRVGEGRDGFRRGERRDFL